MVGIRMRALSCAAFVAITSCMANPFTGNSCFQETVSVPMGTCGSMKSKVLATFIVIQRISVASLIECMVYLRAQVGICAANSTASKAKLANVENLLARRGASVGLSTEDCTATYADICGSADKVSLPCILLLLCSPLIRLPCNMPFGFTGQHFRLSKHVQDGDAAHGRRVGWMHA